MDAKLGHETDALNFLAALAREPYRYDFYQTLRRLECLYPDKPRWGSALRPIDEPVRLGQDPDLAFAPAPLASLEFGPEGTPPRLQVRLFGLLGPNGPLPIHLTEYARDRLRHAGDPTLSRFLDLLHHRFIALFYRAWAQAQPHVNRDRPTIGVDNQNQDRFSIYVGALVGVARPALRDRDSLPDVAKLFHAGTLVRHVRSAEGLEAILRQFFRVPVRIEEFVGHWMVIDTRERTYLRRDGVSLGGGAVLGAKVWDHQHKFRIHLGPLTLGQYEAFLPATPVAERAGAERGSVERGGVERGGVERGDAEGGGEERAGAERGGVLLRKLVDWVRFYLCFELDWDVRLRLERREVPRLTLGGRGRLGWTTWLGNRTSARDADDLCLDGEMFVDRDRVA
jgi:type VI secretion system protein ImpH